LKKYFTTLLIIALYTPIQFAKGQVGIRKDSITSILKSMPSFSIYKENYFITGIPMDAPTTIHNSDIKMQISFKQRLTNAVLPFKSYLFLTYTQKSFWKIYEKSSPFDETIFNPGIGLGKFVFKGNRQIGIMGFQFEHESNGKDSIFSRSWNCASFSYMAYLNSKVTLIGKAWIPFTLSDNPDLMHYIGYGELTINWQIIKNKLLINAIIRKGNQWDLRGSIQTGIYYNPLKNANQYFYLQFFDGYAENLIRYSTLTNMLRIGICIRPTVMIF
jgi:phospholipase A1